LTKPTKAIFELSENTVVRRCEERSDEAIYQDFWLTSVFGLLRFARNGGLIYIGGVFLFRLK